MRESRRSTEPVMKNNLISSCRASVEHYSNEPTDTTSSGTSSKLKEALCNSTGEKIRLESRLTCGGQEKIMHERAGFRSRGCPWMINRGRQFYPSFCEPLRVKLQDK